MDAAATLKVHPQVIYLGPVSLCLLGGCRREQTLLWAAVSQCPQPRIPTERGFRTWCRSSCLTGRLSSQQRTHSSSLSPQTQHRHKPQRFQAGTRRESLRTGSAAQGCISKRSDRNSTRAPSSVRFVSSATGRNEFYSPRFSFPSGDI